MESGKLRRVRNDESALTNSLVSTAWQDPSKPFLIAGPCVIESEAHCLETAHRLQEIAGGLGLPFVFKASFDKANRTSLSSFRGPGAEEGLRILGTVRSRLGVAVTSDVHETQQVAAASQVLDLIQIPAFLSRQTDLIVAAARGGKPVNIKKGQFLAPWDAIHVLEKARSAGCAEVLITERGTAFGYNNLVVDFTSLPILASLGCRVVFDATHSVQLPGGAGASSGGRREAIPPLIRAAAAVGVDGLFVEVHQTPEKALSDAANAVALDRLEELLETFLEIDRVSRDRRLGLQ